MLVNWRGSENGPSSEAPERRLGTSVMAGSPVPREEERGVVE